MGKILFLSLLRVRRSDHDFREKKRKERRRIRNHGDSVEMDDLSKIFYAQYFQILINHCATRDGDVQREKNPFNRIKKFVAIREIGRGRGFGMAGISGTMDCETWIIELPAIVC